MPDHPDTLPKITLDQAQGTLNEARITALASTLMVEIRDHMQAGTHKHPVVLEALNALAVNVAVLLAGTGNDSNARRFFSEALQNQLRDLAS